MGTCWFQHPEKKEEQKKIGGFDVSFLKADARSMMNDEDYREFERACDGGSAENVLAMMLHRADKNKK